MVIGFLRMNERNTDIVNMSHVCACVCVRVSVSASVSAYVRERGCIDLHWMVIGLSVCICSPPLESECVFICMCECVFGPVCACANLGPTCAGGGPAAPEDASSHGKEAVLGIFSLMMMMRIILRSESHHSTCRQ